MDTPMPGKAGLRSAVAVLTETFGLGRAAAISAILLVGSVSVFTVFWFFSLGPCPTPLSSPPVPRAVLSKSPPRNTA